MIQITNTLKTGETKLPEAGTNIRMFVCGPTVYDYVHIGNARTFVVFDVIAKYLRYRGHDVNYIQNITDIDDRIIKRAQETGQNWKELSEKFEKIFLENMKSLKVDSVDKYPRATDHIPEIIKQVKTLIEKGNAYLIEDDPVKSPDGDNGASGYYFDLKTFPEYGKLSGRTAEMAEDAVSRIDESSGKRNKGDFCLWKLAPHRSETSGAGFLKEGEPSWESELGTGRPGWHIEDTAITEKYFGPQYEIHGGGQDLIFPHHEAEIAQQESASGLKPFVKYWLHVGFLVNKGGKMSKSAGNFLTVEEALKKYSPEALRFYFLSAHYRTPLDYNEEQIKLSRKGIENISEVLTHLQKAKNEGNLKKEENPILAQKIDDYFKFILGAMDNDFNTQEAFGILSGLVSDTYQNLKDFDLKSYQKFMEVIEFFDKVFGSIIIPEVKTEKYEGIQITSSTSVAGVIVDKEITDLAMESAQARQEGNFDKADRLRKKLREKGFDVENRGINIVIIKR